MVNKNKYCLNPLGRHSKTIYATTNSSLKSVSENLSKLVKGLIKVNSLLCSNCCTHIRKNPEMYINRLSEETQEISDNESSASTLASSTDVGMADAKEVDADQILALSGVSPIKKSKNKRFI